MKNPTSFEMLEKAYLKIGDSRLDQYLINSLSGQALRDRLQAVIKYGTDKIQEMSSTQLQIVNYGSGTSRDLIAIMSNLRLNFNIAHIKIDCIDIDDRALGVAKNLITQERLTDNFNLCQKNFLSLNYHHSVSIAFLIGILCGLPSKHCVLLLRKLKKHFAKDCIVVASNVLTTMREQNPEMSFILKNIIGWNLVYKTPQELRKIFEAAGYQWLGCFYDKPLQFHIMGIATPIF